MVRPAVSEWESVFGFTDDPTPGDADMLGRLARSYRSVANDAGDALPLVSQLENQQVGEGKSMEKLRDKLGDLAKQVRKLHSSYDQAAGALDTYVTSLRDMQTKADNALSNGREAKERLDSATSVVSALADTISHLDSTVIPPDDDATRRSTRRALDEAESNHSSARHNVDDAQADLDAARALAEDARSVREEDAATAARALDEARDEAVAGKSIWEKIRDKLSLAFGIIGGVLGVLAMLIPGLQGLGLALTIGSFAFSAAAFGINIAKSAETGEWDPLDIVLSVIGLAGGVAPIVKGVKGMVNAIKVGGAGAIGSGIKGLGAEIKLIPEALTKTLPHNTSIVFNDVKRGFGGIINATKGLGSKIDSVIAGVRNPGQSVVTSVAKTIAALRNFKPANLRLPTVSGLLGASVPWSRPEVGGFFLGVAGLIYGGAAYAKHSIPPSHDPSYLDGTT
ncbi:putative T7SS-secreted protein [Streptomyces sp. NPDC017993]|uniref:putative T7SS-secreted protein n=1 Tax=Streptomyces sp. NPDC017993 TaxID=3365027 RepID=UPI0037B43164